jgi:hypothetical protein
MTAGSTQNAQSPSFYSRVLIHLDYQYLPVSL